MFYSAWLYLRGAFCYIAQMHLHFFSQSLSVYCYLEKHFFKGHLCPFLILKERDKSETTEPWGSLDAALSCLAVWQFFPPSAGSICYMTLNMNECENKGLHPTEIFLLILLIITWKSMFIRLEDRLWSNKSVRCAKQSGLLLLFKLLCMSCLYGM